MKRYLLDTNAFFEMLSFLAGRNVRADAYNFEEIKQGECYISKITELEILSVIGKYGRGEPSKWQNCDRQIAEDDLVQFIADRGGVIKRYGTFEEFQRSA